MQLAPGAWCLNLETPTLPPATATNTLVLGTDRLLVVEPATPHAREQARLDALLDELQAEGRRPYALALTHHHVDHIGYARALADRLGVPIYAHAQTAARLDFEVESIDEGWRCDLGGGQVVEALFTPGHAPGHLVFWEHATAVAHVGDLVAGEGSILIDASDGGDMSAYLDSLRRMLARCRGPAGELRATPGDADCDALLDRASDAGVDRRGSARPGPRFVAAHGPVIEDPVALLDGYIRHRLDREAKVRSAVAEGGARAFQQILASAYADTPEVLWPFAAMALEAHLRKLVADGVLVSVAGGYGLGPGPG